MNILLLVATELESHRINASFDFVQDKDWLVAPLPRGKVYLLHSGIGMVSTAYMLGRFLALREVDLAINLGIAGSFDRTIKLGEVVEIVEDNFAEMGAEDGADWLHLPELGFAQFEQEEKSFFNTFTNPSPSAFSVRKVTALTLNRTHGYPDSIDKVQKYWPKQVESMEGAAFFHAMIRAKIPFYAFRSISNYVELRNKDAWEIPLAVRNMEEWLIENLKLISEQ